MPDPQDYPTDATRPSPDPPGTRITGHQRHTTGDHPRPVRGPGGRDESPRDTSGTPPTTCEDLLAIRVCQLFVIPHRTRRQCAQPGGGSLNRLAKQCQAARECLVQ